MHIVFPSAEQQSLADNVSPLKVLLMANIPWDNAVAGYALSLCTGLLDRGHDVCLVVKPNSPAEQRALELNLPKVHSLDLRSASPWKVANNILSLRRLIGEFCPDVINVFHSADHQYAFLCNRDKKTAIIRTRGNFRSAKKHPGNAFMYRCGADAHIACADFISDRHYVELGVSSEKIKLIKPGLDVTWFREGIVPQSNARSQLGLDENDIVVGHVGRYTRIKAHDYVLRAFAELPEIGGRLPRLLFTGIEYDVKVAELKKLADELGVRDRVIFLSGRQFDVQTILCSLDLLVVPSISSEAISRVALEALALGVPTVASQLNSLPEILGDLGMYWDPGDIEGMRSSMLRGLTDEVFRKRFVREGPARVETRYNRTTQIDLTEQLYRRCLAERATRFS